MTLTRQAEIAQWARATFGEATLYRQVVRMLEEVTELLGCAENIAMLFDDVPGDALADAFAEECADVWICAARIAEEIDYDMESRRKWWPAKRRILRARAVFVADYATALLVFAGSDLNYDPTDRHQLGARLRNVIDGLWACCDFVGRDLLAAVDAKMAKNRARVWVVDGTGCGRHA